MPKIRERGSNYSMEYVISLPTSPVKEEMSWENRDVLEGQVFGGVKLSLLRKGRRKRASEWEV